QTGIDSFLVTYSLMGPLYAIIRVVVAFLSGIVTGLSVVFLGKEQSKEQVSCCCKIKEAASSSCCSTKVEERKSVISALHYGLIEMPRSLGKELFLGLILGALVLSFVPDNFFADNAIGTGFTGMVLMLLVGLPVYVCSSASVPIAVGLVLAGFSPGAVLVFLVTGPATNIVTITTLFKNTGVRNTIIYLVSLIVVTFGFGLLVDAFDISAQVTKSALSCHGTESSIFNIICGVVLLILLASGFKRK
ncbi:MAG: permease, partial [Lentisphaeria bacterium]